jgi:protoporphyrin/coproporphyrin ferrochelatase
MAGREPSGEAVIFIGFGGPTTGIEVRPFLDRVLACRPISRERYEEVVRHYETLGGRSPYNEITLRQATALELELRRMGTHAPVVTGFRFTPPFLYDVLRDLKQRSISRVLGFVLAAHRCDASWDRYLEEVKSARERLAWHTLEIEYPPLWHDDPAFVETVADRARAALELLDARVRGQAELIFTAHSIPLSMGGRAGYVEQLNESARLIAQRLGRYNWTMAFQSRSGSPRDPWLEPDIKDALRRLAGAQVVVVPLGFLCDHVEVLYDLDIESARTAREAGVTMVRAATVGEHPKFINMLARIARPYLSAASSRNG